MYSQSAIKKLETIYKSDEYVINKLSDRKIIITHSVPICYQNSDIVITYWKLKVRYYINDNQFTLIPLKPNFIRLLSTKLKVKKKFINFNFSKKEFILFDNLKLKVDLISSISVDDTIWSRNHIINNILNEENF